MPLKIKMQKYYTLPTMKSQLLKIGIAAVAYGVLIFYGDTFLPSLSDSFKKKSTQYGIAFIFVGSLAAGLTFVLSARARSNFNVADAVRKTSPIQLSHLNSLHSPPHHDFSVQIQAEKARAEEANRQIAIVESLPRVIESAGMFALILIALGSFACFIGAT